MVSHHPGIAELAVHECLSLLRTTTVGRLAIAGDEHPEVFPINYVVDRATVVFRTAPGTKLAALTAHRDVTFETDAYDATAARRGRSSSRAPPSPSHRSTSASSPSTCRCSRGTPRPSRTSCGSNRWRSPVAASLW